MLLVGGNNMATFNEIIAIAKFRKQEDSKVDQIREQRRLAGEILAGRVFHGMELTLAEERFVRDCNRSMCPLSAPALSALTKINKRRWS